MNADSTQISAEKEGNFFCGLSVLDSLSSRSGGDLKTDATYYLRMQILILA